VNCVKAESKEMNQLPIGLKSIFEEMDETAKEERLLVVTVYVSLYQVKIS
jgi:hypothetical protein